LEAMACGLPMVASRTGGLRELVDDRRTGMQVLAADADSLTVALEALIGDRELRRQLGSNANAKVLEKYSMQAMAERTLEVYFECLRDKAGKVL
jgi:glycosyltransferase involved in cell wall biosynthesis